MYKKHDNDKNLRSNQKKIASIIASAEIILLLTLFDEETIVLMQAFCAFYMRSS